MNSQDSGRLRRLMRRAARSASTAVSCAVALAVALGLGVFGASALWSSTVTTQAEVGSGVFVLNFGDLAWEGRTGDAASGHSGDSLSTIPAWVAVEGESLVITAEVSTTLRGANLDADLVATGPESLPEGFTGTMAFKDSNGTLAGPVDLDSGETLRLTSVPANGTNTMVLEVVLNQKGLGYIDPIAYPQQEPEQFSLGAITVTLEQVRARNSSSEEGEL
ncbi:MAG: hypothetical protein LBJ08_08890 [Bifidobacteriaceae bacterium]|jgi:alternate signal-mediated exported protein|nr:hypothetical protein [Bifidobacteriaceae bacterium]